MSALRANLLALGAGIPITVLCLYLVRVFGYHSKGFLFTDILIATIVFLPVAVVHELLHGTAAIVHGRLHLADMHVGVYWKGLALTCGVRVPIRVRTARVVAITPLAVTGPLGVAALIAFPSNVTALLAAYIIVGAVVDLFTLYKLRPFDGNLLFVDHPHEPVFEIYASS